MRQRRRTHTQNKKTKRSCKEKHKKCAALKQISVSFCSAPFFSALTKMGRTVQNKTSWQPHSTAWQAPFKHSPLSAAVAVLPPAQLCLLLPENCQRWGFMLWLYRHHLPLSLSLSLAISLSCSLSLVLCGLAALFTLSLCCPDMFCVLLAWKFFKGVSSFYVCEMLFKSLSLSLSLPPSVSLLKMPQHDEVYLVS